MFYVHGLSGHETMPMNRLFEKRPVNKTDKIYAYHGIENRHVGGMDEQSSKKHQSKGNASQAYQSVETQTEKDLIVTAAEIMVSPVEILLSTSMVSDAIQLFQGKKFRHVPVVSPEKGLIGMVSDRDVLRYLGEKSLEAEAVPHTKFSSITEVMTTDVVSASNDTDVRYIARLFVEGKIGAMPIVDNGKLTGILTRSDILRAVMKNFHIGLWA